MIAYPGLKVKHRKANRTFVFNEKMELIETTENRDYANYKGYNWGTAHATADWWEPLHTPESKFLRHKKRVEERHLKKVTP